MTDKEKFLEQAKSYIGKNGNYVCNTKLCLGYIDHWCAFSVSAIMQDCGFIGKYIREVTGGAGTIPRYSDGIFGTWFKKSVNVPPQAGDLFFLRYADYPRQDKYFCDHIGIIESVNGNTLTTLEGNVDGVSGNWAATSVFKRKVRYLNDSTVYAFYRPKWETEKTTATASKTETKIYQLNSSASVNFNAKIKSSDGLNIRQGAGINYQILGEVPYNSIVKVTKRTSGNGYTWGLVTYNGVTGWIALDYTETIDFQKGNNVKLKSGATVYGTNITLDNWVYSTKFKIMEIDGNRAIIGVNGQITSAVDIKYLESIDS